MSESVSKISNNPRQNVLIEGSADISWSYPDIGTAGIKMDVLRIEIFRTRAIDAIVIAFDGERDGWVIFSEDLNLETGELETKEVAFIPEPQ